MKRSLFLITLLLGQTACEKGDSGASAPAKRGNASAEKSGPSLLLTWEGSKSPVGSYHVFYQAAPGKDLEIDSLSEEESNVPKPSLRIDSSNLESFPAAGKEACFYVVAENSGTLSEPSDKVCIKI